MKQPLMLTPVRVPPAQVEALYDAALVGNERPFPADSGPWPGEDWEEDVPAHRPAPASEAGKGRVAQH